MVLFLAGCASLPRNVERVPSRALEDFRATPLARAVALAQPGPDASGFRLLPSGDVAFKTRLALVDQAGRTLDLQYYLIEDDPSMRELFTHVRRAIERGVRVRLLLDDLHAARHDAALARFATRPNVEVRLFNPFPAGRDSTVSRFLLAADDLRRLTRRMHNKLFVVDNAVAITGGRNLAGEYFQRTGDVNFADLDVLAAGAVVRDLSRSFDRYWNSPLSYPIAALTGAPPAGPTAGPGSTNASAPPSPPPPPPGQAVADFRLIWAPARVLADRPSKVEGSDSPSDQSALLDDLLAIVGRAEREVAIISPYFIPGPEVTAVFGKIRARGVIVRVLTNSLATTDVPAAYAAYLRHCPELLALGVELYELRSEPGQRRGFLRSSGESRPSLHAKAILVDGHLAFVGSMNLDPRSALENTEVGLLIDSPELGRRLAGVFAQGILPEDSYALRLVPDTQAVEWVTRDGAEERRYRREPEAGFWRRLGSRLLGFTVPEELL